MHFYSYQKIKPYAILQSLISAVQVRIRTNIIGIDIHEVFHMSFCYLRAQEIA